VIYLAVQPGSEPDHTAQRRATITRYFAAIQNGDYSSLLELLTPDAITRWPQSSERITGALSCVRVHENYPGGPPSYRVARISGGGNVWVAELVADYGDDRWHVVSVIEFDGPRISGMTDYFSERCAS
jgi:hypothetical protein